MLPDYDALYEELSQEATKFPASPGNHKDPETEPGEEEFIAGPIVEVGVWRSAEYGDSVTVVVRDEKTGLRIHYASSSITKRFFGETPPRVGRHVGIFYGGLRQLRGGGHYHHYQCRYLDEIPDEPVSEAPEQASEPPPAPETPSDEQPKGGDDDIPF